MVWKVISRRARDVGFHQGGKMDGWMRQPVIEELTSKHQSRAGEWYVPGEEIENFGVIPRGTPNVLHFLGQDQ